MIKSLLKVASVVVVEGAAPIIPVGVYVDRSAHAEGMNEIENEIVYDA